MPWAQQNSPTGASLRGLSVVSTEIAWAAGENGTWLRTVDGGKNWQVGVVPGAEDRDLRDIEAFDADRAVVMAIGSPARFWHSSDGGESWAICYRNDHPQVFFNSMAFADDQQGYAFSDPVDGLFLLIGTADGGRNWWTIEELPRPRKDEGGFAASGTCLTARGQSLWIGTGGGASRVFRSPDGGRSFVATEVPMASGQPSQGLFSLAFRDLRNGVAVGGDYLEPQAAIGNAAFTADGGRSWHAVPGAPPSGYRSGVAFLPGAPAPTCFAVGPNGIDVSLDGGLSWQRVADDGFHALSFAPDGPAGWAVGPEGRIARYDAREPARNNKGSIRLPIVGEVKR